MLQSRSHMPAWLARLASRPQSIMARLRYRLVAWTSLPASAPPEHVISALTPEDDTFRQLSFTFAVIALSARVACADGPLTKDKYIAFREGFPLGGGICGKIRQLFTLACTNDTPTEHYINQLRYMYPGKEELFASVTDRLFSIATADGLLTRESELLLSDIAHGLGVSPAAFAAIRERHDRPAYAHAILGIAPGFSSAALKKRYHELMRRYHPDRYGNEILSDELRLLLRAKTAEINSAYRILSKKAA